MKKIKSFLMFNRCAWLLLSLIYTRKTQCNRIWNDCLVREKSYASVLIHMREPLNVQHSNDKNNSRRIRDYNYYNLLNQSQRSQYDLTLYLKENLRIHPSNIICYWIQNIIMVQQLNCSIINHILKKHGDKIFYIEEDQWIKQKFSGYGSNDDHISRRNFEKPTSNIKAMQAPSLWKMGIWGHNVTIASIDSGVRYTHEALKANYRGFQSSKTLEWNHDYAYWIPSNDRNQALTPDEADPVGHGTHTMGIAVGSMGIGMSPHSTWITARPFNAYGNAKKSDILLAAQWVMCPTNFGGSHANCSLGADIVTNSFGGNSSFTWMNPIVKIWKQSGILSTFASGNTNGFQCQTVLCPGCSEDTLSIGALVGSFTLWGGSGKGPTSNGLIKPDFVAPGVSILSALSIQDDKYTRLTGTSMATPHVAGSMALLLSFLKGKLFLHNQLHYYQWNENIIEAMKKTASSLKKPFLVPSHCGGIPYSQYPNNIYGWGLPQVCSALKHWGFNCSSKYVLLTSSLSMD